MTSQIKILLVEDEAITVMALKIELKQAGFHVIGSVASGEETLSAVSQNKPDIILMDMRLAGSMSGLDTAVQIRQTDLIPIVFLTGYPDTVLTERINQMGAAAYVLKPATVEAIQEAIEAVLKK